MLYVATVNVPGYLPEDDEPPQFETTREAWEYLADERERDEDAAADGTDGTYSDVVDTLRTYAIDAHGTGTVYGPTPGSDSPHDLGLAYCVSVAEGTDLDDIPHADYPHEPGRLHDCPRCESECFCTGRQGDTECVFCASLSEAFPTI